MNFLSLDERYHDADFWTSKIQLELFRLIKNHLESTGLSQNKFAEQLGVSKGYMSQVLNGNFDHRLSKLVGLALAVGKVPMIQYEEIDKVIKLAKREYEPLRSTYVSQSQSIVFEEHNPDTGVLHNETPGSNIIFKDVA